MLREILEALEKRKQTIELQKAEDIKRREVVVPMITEIANLLVKVINQSSNESSSPEEAYNALRASVVDLHTELVANINSMNNADVLWQGRHEELRQIISDMTKLRDLAETASDPEPEPEPEPEVKVRARPRSVGQKPQSLRQTRNKGE